MIKAVYFDVGETLVDESREYGTWADWLNVPRHTYATVSMDNGIDPKIISDRLGHSSMDYTLRISTIRSTGRDVDAAATVADIVFGEDWEPPSSQGDEDTRSGDDPDDEQQRNQPPPSGTR